MTDIKNKELAYHHNIIMPMKQPYNRALSTYKKNKILFHFCYDINATLTSNLLGINHNTINKYFMLFRTEIYEYQISKFHSIIGRVELDESYFKASRIKRNKVKLKRDKGKSKQPVFGVFADCA